MGSSMNQVRTASGINAILGLWLIASPWIYGYDPLNIKSVWNSVIVGVVIAAFGTVRLRLPEKAAALSWVNTALGAWIVISPWLYNYADTFGRRWNAVVLGVLVIVLAARSANTTLAERRTHAHG